MDGRPVVNRVALVLKNVQEAAQNHLQVMAEELVQEHRSKDSCATPDTALVRNKTCFKVGTVLFFIPSVITEVSFLSWKKIQLLLFRFPVTVALSHLLAFFLSLVRDLLSFSEPK